MKKLLTLALAAVLALSLVACGGSGRKAPPGRAHSACAALSNVVQTCGCLISIYHSIFDFTTYGCQSKAGFSFKL